MKATQLNSKTAPSTRQSRSEKILKQLLDRPKQDQQQSHKHQLADDRDQRISDLTRRLQHLETQSEHFATQNERLEAQIEVLKQQRPLNSPLPKLTGKQDFMTWKKFLCDLYEVGNAHGWEADQYCAYFPMCLEGEVQAAYRLLPAATRGSWEELLPALATLIRPSLTPEQARQKLAECRQLKDEAPSEYMLRIKWFAERAYETTEGATTECWTQEQQERIVVATFRNGLLPELYAEATKRDAAETSKEELKKVITADRILTIIQTRAQEHEANNRIEAAPKELYAKKMEVAAEAQHEAVVQAMEVTSEHERKQRQLDQNIQSSKRRRKPRKARCRNVQRRLHLRQRNEEATNSEDHVRVDNKEENDA